MKLSHRYTNDAGHPVTKRINGKQVVICPFYKRWMSMIGRTYPSFHRINPAYIDCSICKEWRIFSSFKQWMEGQDWKGMELDKDIIFPGNKIYGPEFCSFVDKATNNLFTGRSEKKHKYPMGVSWSKKRNCFIAQCKNGNGKLTCIGGYDSKEDAHSAYLLYKATIVRTVAARQGDSRVTIALNERAAIMEMELKPDKR